MTLRDLGAAIGKIAAKIGFDLALALGTGGSVTLLKAILMGSHLAGIGKLFTKCKQ
jgi:hypothetical protein